MLKAFTGYEVIDNEKDILVLKYASGRFMSLIGDTYRVGLVLEFVLDEEEDRLVYIGTDRGIAEKNAIGYPSMYDLNLSYDRHVQATSEQISIDVPSFIPLDQLFFYIANTYSITVSWDDFEEYSNKYYAPMDYNKRVLHTMDFVLRKLTENKLVIL